MPLSSHEFLSQLRRYKRLLVLGSGLIMTLMVLLAFSLALVAEIRAYRATERQAFTVARDLIMNQVAEGELSFLVTLTGAELAWLEGTRVNSDWVKAFRRSGGEMSFPPSSTRRSQLVFAPDANALQDDEVRRYGSLGEYLTRARLVHSVARGLQYSGYFYGVRQDIAGITPSSSSALGLVGATRAERERLLAALSAGLGDLGSSHEDPQARRKPRWLPVAISPLTGKPAIRIAGPLFYNSAPTAILVTEYEPDFLLVPLVTHNYLNGIFTIVSDGGSVVASTTKTAVGGGPANQQQMKKLIKTTGETWQQGRFTLVDHLGSTGWVIMHTYSLQDIWAGIMTPILTSAAIALLALMTTWVFLFYLRNRVLRPALDTSQRVFESEKLSRMLIETAPVGLGLIAMQDGTPLLCSPAMIEIANKVILPARTLSAELLMRYQKSVQDGRPANDDLLYVEVTLPTHDDDSIDLAVGAAPARYQAEDVLIVSLMNVSAQKRVQQQLHNAREAADLANAAKSAFLAMMSHEIRTPLNAVLGNLELLAKSRLDAFQHDRLNVIRTSSEGLLAIISDVLDFSKIEAGEMTLEHIEFDALDVMTHSAIIFDPLARAKGTRLIAEFGSKASLLIQGDPTRLGQVINNLLSNAVKFTEEGEVVLRLSVPEGTVLQIEVRDSGIGMSAEQQATIFQPFSQADRSITRKFGGTGLGLALCARITEAMGGSIAVRSEPDGGSSFVVRVPIGEPQSTDEMPRFGGEIVALVAARNVCHTFSDSTLRAWGLTVHMFRHPAQIADDLLQEVEAVILCGDGIAWTMEDENRLTEDASWVIDCRTEGPLKPVVARQFVRVSSFSLKGLVQALQYCLHGTPLPGVINTETMLPRRLSVLVAEDNDANRRLFEDQLKLLSCEVVVSSDGKQALDKLSRQTFDVLITDLWMPNMDGYALALEARTRWPQMPVIAATASVTLEERDRCRAAGIAQVVAKPLPLARLQTVLAQATGQRTTAAQTEISDENKLAQDGLLTDGTFPAGTRQIFFDSIEASLTALATAQQEGDAPRLLAELHSLRGALRFFESEGTNELCDQLQSGVQEHGVQAAAGLLGDFEIAVQATILRHSQTPEEALLAIHAAANRVSPEQLAGWLLRVLQLALRAYANQQNPRDEILEVANSTSGDVDL